MAKKTDPSYEAMCKVQAAIYGKMAKASSYTLFSCYVRSATNEYANACKDSRIAMLEDATREDAIGYRIAKAMLAQGWDADSIVDLTDAQQSIVNAAEDCCDFQEVLLSRYPTATSWGRPSNSVRWEWFKDGAPAIPEFAGDED